MRPLSRLALAAGVTLVLCAVAGVIGVVSLLNPPSPTTRITSDDGSEITLDWRDYPAFADPSLDPQDVLDAPRAGDVAAVVSEQIDELSTGLTPALPGVGWNPADPDAPILFPADGNGYGGESLHLGYNVTASTTGTLPEGHDWNALTDALAGELSALGYADVVWDFDRAPYPGQTRSEHEDEVVSQHGSLDPDEMWMWSGMAQQGSLWVMITIWDERRGAPEDAWPEETTGLDLLFGGTVISQDDEAAYADGVAPFEGLARPDSTSSD
ncbi:hypothetical protein [Labedella endophytica]|uniref:Uncharacterized protein n=1 Tax=Labedella endophytica TaxID=1523160 RepID=A0A3S0Y103_9MICO|nr:hypothetical protein [Labedella endophytica]RUR01718.1 hypothetical protein ELQ94_09655 [Labedella endophytica]